MTKTDNEPKVIIRRSWIVLTMCEDHGEYRVEDEEFLTEPMAHQYATEQAAKHGIKLTYGQVSD